jgi:acyl dehydratase
MTAKAAGGREPLFLDDLAPGQIFRTGEILVDAEAIRRFAAEFDPQPFHLDEVAAAASFFGGLAASGWHTAALTMRLLATEGAPLAGGVIGAGMDELRWPRPVRPGDRLTVRTEVLEVRPSRSKPDRGTMRLRVETVNQNGEVVQSFVPQLVVMKRNSSA